MKYYSNSIYPVALVLSYDAESVDKEYYNAAEGEDKPVILKLTSEAVTMFLSRRAPYYAMAVGVLFNKKPTPKLMAHEAFHTAIMMLDVGCHIPFTDSTEEVYAYLIGWIVECMEDFSKHVKFIKK